jgi:hypothetical protein
MSESKGYNYGTGQSDKIMRSNQVNNKEGFPVRPNVKVTSTQSKTEAVNTHGGAQGSEAHYRKVLQGAMGQDGVTTYSKRRPNGELK